MSDIDTPAHPPAHPHHFSAAERAHRLARLLANTRFFWLLLALIAYIVITPDVPSNAAGRAISAVQLIAIFAAATYSARGGRTRVMVMLVLSALFLGVASVSLFYSIHGMVYVNLSVLLLCLLFTCLCILFFILDPGQIGPDHIYGAMCSYVLIGMIFATVYTMLSFASPGSFANLHTGSGESRWYQLFYFSFTTLSTVGYGDIAPITARARSICIIEQMTGTFYVAILIARLAGLYPAPARHLSPAMSPGVEA